MEKIRRAGNADRARCFQVGIPMKTFPPPTQKAVEYVKKQANDDNPFFLYFAFPSPHHQSFQMTSSMVSQVRGLMGILFMRQMMLVAEFLRHSNRVGRQIIQSSFLPQIMVLRVMHISVMKLLTTGQLSLFVD